MELSAKLQFDQLHFTQEYCGHLRSVLNGHLQKTTKNEQMRWIKKQKFYLEKEGGGKEHFYLVSWLIHGLFLAYVQVILCSIWLTQFQCKANNVQVWYL